MKHISPSFWKLSASPPNTLFLSLSYQVFNLCVRGLTKRRPSRAVGRRNNSALNPAGMQMGNMLLLLVLLLPTIAIAQSICPEDGDSCWGGLGSNVGNKCYYFVNGNSEEVNEKDPSPYNNPTPDRCGSVSRDTPSKEQSSLCFFAVLFCLPLSSLIQTLTPSPPFNSIAGARQR